jgi:plasmid stabilization system protein ParE
MPTVEFHPGAKDDYDESFDWYAKRSHQAAINFASAIADARDRIVRNPELFAAIDSVHRACSLLRFPFRLIYRIQNTRLVIIAVAHAKRRPKYWLSRKPPSA